MKSATVFFVAIGLIRCTEYSVIGHPGVETNAHAGFAWPIGSGGQPARA